MRTTRAMVLIKRQKWGSLLIVLAVMLPRCVAFTPPISSRSWPAIRTRCQEGSTPARDMLSMKIGWGRGVSERRTTEAQSLKQAILDQASGTSNGLNASAAQRDAISKAVNGLVALNPTNDLTTSELATGMWDLVFTTTPGASGGKLGPFVGEVQQEVDIAAGLYVNYVKLGPLTGELDATWEVVNKKQWKVVFKTISFLLWGQRLVKKDLGQAGLWTLSYLDDDMRILTARSLERETGNLYVLARA